MASRSENITKTFSMTVQGHALLPILFTNTSCLAFFFGVNNGDDPQSQVCIGISPEKTPGGEQECPVCPGMLAKGQITGQIHASVLED